MADAIISGLILGGLYSLIAIGLNLQFGVAKVLNLTHGEIIILFSLITYTLYNVLQISPLISILFISIVAFVLGLAINKLLFQKLQIRSKSEESLTSSTLLVSFGFAFIIQNISLIIWGGDLKSYMYLASPVNLLGATYSLNRVVVFCVATGLCLLIYIYLKRSLFGKAIRAASADIIGAQVIGINIRKVHAISFALGTSIAAIGGVLISMMIATDASAGMPYTIMALIIIIIGGAGNFLGCLFAGFLVGIAEGIGGFLLGPGLRLVVNYGLLVLILLIRPQGIFGGK